MKMMVLLLSHWPMTVKEKTVKEEDNSERTLENNDLDTKQLGEALGKIKKSPNICVWGNNPCDRFVKIKSKEGCLMQNLQFCLTIMQKKKPSLINPGLQFSFILKIREKL
jgi:hypothetical protein